MGCRQDLPRIRAGCNFCGRPLPQAGVCPGCLRRSPPYRALAACRYEYPLPLLIRRLKFHGQAGLGQELGRIMLETCGYLLPTSKNCCLLPMPLHWRRQFRRGFNQSLELARPLAKAMDLSLRTDLCRRRRATRPQTGLRGRQRRDNVREAFEIRTGQLPQHVVIIDDVLTSGHTAAALSRCLRRAGVQEITLLTLARAGIAGK